MPEWLSVGVVDSDVTIGDACIGLVICLHVEATPTMDVWHFVHETFLAMLTVRMSHPLTHEKLAQQDRSNKNTDTRMSKRKRLLDFLRRGYGPSVTDSLHNLRP